MSVFPVGAKVGGEVSGFIGAMASSTRALSAFAGGAGIAGGALGVLAGAAAMGAAIGAAKEYQSELIKLNTLVGISIEEIEEWDGAMRQIAITTGQSASDVARAMFAITSGGARGKDAIDLLEIAAKASAIGLGDMTALGRTAGAMLQAFGDQGLTASFAMDVLVATVKEGNLEAESLSGAFSRVLGPAKALGSSVEDIGGFMATFTRLGGTTEQAATGLLNVFNLLIKPPEDARDAMEEYGISVERIRGIIREDGLQAALQVLVEGLDDNVDAFGRVLPNVRALIGVLNTAGLQSEQYAISQRAIDNANGLTEQSFKTWGDTAEATFERFKSTIGEAALQIGEALLPALSAILLALTPIVAAIAKVVDVTDDLFRALGRNANPALDRFFERMLQVPDAVDAATTEIERMNAELEATGFEGNLLTPVQELRAELQGLTDEELTARIDELRHAVALLSPETEGYSQLARSATRRQMELADELVVTSVALQQRVAVEREVIEALEEEEAAAAGLLLTEKERAEQTKSLLDGLQQEIDLLSLGERQMILNTAALLDDTGALEADVATRLDLIETLGKEVLLREEAKDEAEASANARRDLIQGYEDEILALSDGQDALDLRIASELDETGALKDRVIALQAARDALEEETEAKEDAARASANAIRERERETETIARRRLRALDELDRAAGRLQENSEIAEMITRLKEMRDVSQEWAAIVAEGFNSTIDGTKDVAEAFADMARSIIASLQQIAIQRGITEPLANALFGFLSGGVDLSRGANVAGFGQDLAGAGISNLPPVVGQSFASQTQQGAPAIIVQQSITFAPQLLDGADGARWLRGQQGEITSIVGEAAQQSSGFARALRGGSV